MEWQNIETAPKDGVLILLYGTSIVAPGVFSLGEWHFWEGPIADNDNGNTVGEMNGWTRGYGPTHWMPLPAPPTHD
jgi:hypothetical protein